MASKSPAMDPAHLDAMAGQLNFQDYAHWKAWQDSNSNSLHSPPNYNAQQAQQPISTGNWLSMLSHNPQQALSRLLPQASGIQLASDALGKANAQAGLK